MWSSLSRRSGGLPLYKQVEALIEGAIADGRLGGGERLPSERRLCALLGVNRSTVIQALDDLADRGVLLRRRGSGTYVNGDKWGVQQYPVLNWRPPVLGARPGGQAARIVDYQEEARRAGGRARWVGAITHAREEYRAKRGNANPKTLALGAGGIG